VLSLISLTLVTLPMLIASLYHAVLVYGRSIATARLFHHGEESELLSVITPIKDEPVEVVERYGRHFLKFTEASLVECIVVADYTNNKLFQEVLKVFPFSSLSFLVRRFNGVGGRNGAINDGVRFSASETVALLDIDAYPSEAVLKSMASCDGVCIARWRVCEWSLTRVSKTIAFMTEYGSWLYYKLKSSRGFFIYPLGSGTAIKKKLFEEIGGLRLDVLQDDMWLGIQLLRKEVEPVLVGEMCVGVPQTLAAFFIQQRRWAYGTTDVLKRFGKHILKAPTGAVQKLEALFYLSQPLVSSIAGLGFLLALPASFLEVQRFGVLEVMLLAIFIFSTILETFCTKRFSKDVRIYDPPYVYGRSSAIATLLSIGILPYVIAALIGVKIPYRVTPKSEDSVTEPTIIVILLLSVASFTLSIIRRNAVSLLVSAMPLAASLYALIRLK